MYAAFLWLLLSQVVDGIPDEGPEEKPLPTMSALTAAASKDREQFPAELHRSIFYLVADETTARVLSWVLSSTSLQPDIELCKPHFVAEGVWRLDLRNLKWRKEDWEKVLQSHPYGGYAPMVRGDWLVTEILDTQLSASQHEDGIAAYYRLLYKDAVPKTEAEFLKFWEVDDNVRRHRGHIEGLSQVNRRGRRWIETRDRHGGYFWITRDSLALTTESDPLERPDGTFAHDGSEAIVGERKFSSLTYEEGSVQYYLLTNGKGERVDEAPVQLVEDGTRFRNVASIRTPGSCMQCHVEGIRPIDTNSLVELANKYNTLLPSSDPEYLERIRRFHFGSLDRRVRSAQELYAAAVQMHTGWDGEGLSNAIQNVVRGYDEPLDLQRAAAELGVEPELLKERIVEYSQLSATKPAYLAPAGILVLVGGGECSRDLFAQQFGLLNALMKGVVKDGRISISKPSDLRESTGGLVRDDHQSDSGVHRGAAKSGVAPISAEKPGSEGVRRASPRVSPQRNAPQRSPTPRRRRFRSAA